MPGVRHLWRRGPVQLDCAFDFASFIMIRPLLLGLVCFAATTMSAQAFPDTQCENDEAKCFAVLGSSVKRNGPYLSIRLGNGRHVTLKDKEPFGCTVPCYNYSIDGIHGGFV